MGGESDLEDRSDLRDSSSASQFFDLYIKVNTFALGLIARQPNLATRHELQHYLSKMMM